MEKRTMTGNGVVPSPLRMPDVLENVFHFSFGGAKFPGLAGFEMRSGNNIHGCFVEFSFSFKFPCNPVLEGFLFFRVAVQAGICHVIERAADIMG